jgi:L-iditol 2-dehydrogenase
MIKATISGLRQAELVEVPQPRAKADWVVVKVHVAPMCTEYKAFCEGWQCNQLGHEAAGEVVEVAQPGCVEVGDRVVVMPLSACGKCPLCVAGDYIHCQNCIDYEAFHGTPEGQGTYVQYLLKPDWLLPKIPDGVSYEMASLACCGLGPSFGAMQTMQVSSFDTILITGLGPVGLGAVVNANYRGARIIAVESVPWRVERAHDMGVEHVLDPSDEGTFARIMELTGGVGVDCALDCSGTVAAERLCLDVARRKGQVTFIGECNDPVNVWTSNDLIRKGLTVRGSWHYNLADFSKIMQIIERSPILEKLISHVMPMSAIQEALELSATKETAKILLKPWE